MRHSDPFQTDSVSAVPEIINAQQAFKVVSYPLKQGGRTLVLCHTQTGTAGGDFDLV